MPGKTRKMMYVELEMQAAMRGLGARDGDHIYFSYIPTFTLLLYGKNRSTYICGWLTYLPQKNCFLHNK
jgi:hypothetical protein